MARTKTMAKKSKRGGKGKGRGKSSRKNAPAKGGVAPKKRRWRPGTVTIRMIKRYQKSTKTLMQRAPF
jgi:histone H3